MMGKDEKEVTDMKGIERDLGRRNCVTGAPEFAC